MSDDKSIEVTDLLLSERPDGTKALIITAKNARTSFVFSAEMWSKLGADAQWFEKQKEDK